MSIQLPPLPAPARIEASILQGRKAVIHGYAEAQLMADRAAVLRAVADWLQQQNEYGAVVHMRGWSIEQRLAGATLLVRLSNDLRAAAGEAQR